MNNSNQDLMTSSKTRPAWAWCARLLVFSAIWLLLTNATLSSLYVGSIFIVASSWLSMRLYAPNEWYSEPSIKLRHVASFTLFFLIQSIRSGWQVAKFAFSRQQLNSPDFINFQTSLPPGLPRLFLIHIFSLLPGTVSAGHVENTISLHILDKDSFNNTELNQCEAMIGALFGIDLKNERVGVSS